MHISSMMCLFALPASRKNSRVYTFRQRTMCALHAFMESSLIVGGSK